ncbi:MAG: DEAD/DEAH box helicase [Thermoplasmata archaeon]
MVGFEEFNLNKNLFGALKQMGYSSATEVQEKAIPVIMSGKDVVVRAKTGTGKTGAFLIPIIQSVVNSRNISTVIISPTRELSQQTFRFLKKMVAGSDLKIGLVYGGSSIEAQITFLKRGINILVGTPGRIIDLADRGKLSLSHVKYFVLDEADQMLDMGFMEDIKYIISKMPEERQTMLFSATMPKDILDLAMNYMDDPEYLVVGKEEEIIVNNIKHKYTVADKRTKVQTLISYIDRYNPKKAIIFSQTKRNADYLYRILMENGYSAVVIHGDLRQSQRERSLLDFRNGARFLIATNVAARGLDIRDVSEIINYDIPEDPNVYVHRSGRTARMGADGSTFSIVSRDDLYMIKNIERFAKIKMDYLKVFDDESSNPESFRATFKRSQKGYGRDNRRFARPRSRRVEN